MCHIFRSECFPFCFTFLRFPTILFITKYYKISAFKKSKSTWQNKTSKKVKSIQSKLMTQRDKIPKIYPSWYPMVIMDLPEQNYVMTLRFMFKFFVANIIEIFWSLSVFRNETNLYRTYGQFWIYQYKNL